MNTQTKVLDTNHGRILCIADIRGRLSALNDLAREANAKAIIHTGDFGFFGIDLLLFFRIYFLPISSCLEANSLERINDRTLRHLTMYSPLIPSAQRTHLLAQENSPDVIRSTVNIELLSEFPLLLSGQIKIQVPVYTVWGACEDVSVLEKFRTGAYTVENLHVLDEATTRCLDVGGVKLRLLGLGGALVPHKLFDNGDGSATIAGGQGTMWTTALQIGELVDTAQRVFDQSETRLLITHASPGREGIIAQLALVLKADLTVSASLHFRYATSYNEFSVQADFEGFRHKLALGKDGFDKVWDSVKTQVDVVIDEHQRVLLDKALNVIERLPQAQPSSGPGATATGEEPAWKNCWNWNLCDAAFGSLILDVKEGRISAELRSQGQYRLMLFLCLCLPFFFLQVSIMLTVDLLLSLIHPTLRHLASQLLPVITLLLPSNRQQKVQLQYLTSPSHIIWRTSLLHPPLHRLQVSLEKTALAQG